MNIDLGPHLSSWITFDLFENHSQEHLHRKCGIDENTVHLGKCLYAGRAARFVSIYIKWLVNVNLSCSASNRIIGDELQQFHTQIML